MNDYKLRQELINNIVSLVVNYNLDGINIDFEYMKDEDKDLFSRFIIELEPRLKEIGAVLSVDVTAPDGSPEWSLCYDRYTIGKVADYIVFMAYDQNGISSPVEGTTAGYNWVEANIQKFLGQEGVESDKLILGIPFYTRVWEENSDGEIISKDTISMKNIDSIVPEGASKTWDDDLKQYYIEYVSDGITHKIWAEDEESIKAKLSLINKYDLAGASFWTKDREPDSIWSIVSESLGVE
jgi:spore germination protein YaaH